MVGIMATDCGDKIRSLIASVTFAADNPSKLQNLHQLKHQLLKSVQNSSISLSDFLPSLLKLLSDDFSPVRKCISEVIGEIGLKHLEFLPEIIPALLTVVDDDTPAVARQAITSCTNIFCCTLEKIAIQGLHERKLDDLLESTWEWMLKLKEKIYTIAFESGSDGIRLLALKFVASIILIYTPDPNGGTEPPTHPISDSDDKVVGKEMGFNISWLRKGHPFLKLGELSVEATQSLGLLLGQLRLPMVKSLSTSMMVVLINCLSAIAVKRPSFYGRVLPVLLGLDPSNSVVKELHAYGVQNALKTAFLSCLKCAHPSATPWRDRLLDALREMGVGDLAEQALEGVSNINGNVKQETPVSIVKEEVVLEHHDAAHTKVGRKRSSGMDVGNRNEDDDTPGKRARSVHIVSEELTDKSNIPDKAVEVKPDTTGKASISNEDDSAPVRHLIGLFGDLVAQGEKAAASLQILISGISADLLADVVIANLRNLPSTCPMIEGDELQANIGLQQNSVDTESPFRQISSFLTNAFHCSDSKQTSAMDAKPLVSYDIEDSHAMDVADNNVACTVSNKSTELVDSDIPCAVVSDNLLEIPKVSAGTSELQDVGPTDTAIPGLDNAHRVGLRDFVASSSLASTDLDDGSQDQATSVGRRSIAESLPSVSTEKSEELSSRAAAVDANIGMASTATSLGSLHNFVLPKMSAPVVELSGEDNDALQKLVFLRIVEAYKQVAVCGGSQLRFSLLSYLGVELSLELDLWTCLQTHILSDYVIHEGHEMTLRVLYRLYGEAEEERDFFSSTTATSVYETFLLKVAETLKDSFPASDKSLSRLFSEVPYLPQSSLKLLESLCSPEIGDKEEKELHSGDRVTQGLSAVWNLIMLRPTLRDVLLKIALQSAVHHMEEVRMKAIRLVANKLYPLSSISLQIEEFAKEKLLSVVDSLDSVTEGTENSNIQWKKNTESVLAAKDQISGEIMATDSSTHTSQSCSPGSIADTSVSDAQRCMSLYFALCTKKHALLRQIFIIFRSSPESVRQAVHSHMPILIRTMGASPSLLEIISDPPDGSEKLLIQVLHTLTDGRVPSAELISTIKTLYETKIKDMEILFPILSFLPKEEVLRVFPHVIHLSQEKFQAALARLLQGSTPGPVLTPSEILIAIHSIDPDKDGIPLKKITDACNACFEQRQMFTQQVIAKVLNQLVEQIPLPLLFMRTVLQAIGAFPALVDFIMDILSRLVSKQIWKYPKLWVGFLKCAQLTQPHSFKVLLQLPQAQLEAALNKIPALKAPLATHVNQQDIKSTLPRSVLMVLGIASESQAPSQSQSGQPEAGGDAVSSDKDVVTEKSKEASGGSGS